MVDRAVPDIVPAGGESFPLEILLQTGRPGGASKVFECIESKG
jgi:hypothetical protein